MRVQIVILLIATGFCLAVPRNTSDVTQYNVNKEPCRISRNVTEEYRKSFLEYLMFMSKRIFAQSKQNSLFSGASIWLSLAALAEGADPLTRQQLFQFLHLPEDWCVRQEYYKIATKYNLPGHNVDVKSIGVLVVDDDMPVNSSWKKFVSNNGLLRFANLPMQKDPKQSMKRMEQMISAPKGSLNVTGKSALISAVDYSDLWKTAFADANIERSPFYNQRGDVIGYVDLLRIKKRVRIAHHPVLKTKFLEIPIGDGRYRMVFAITERYVDFVAMEIPTETVFHVLNSFEETAEPVEVAIPQMAITSQIDVRTLLEGFGMDGLWAEGVSNRFISQPVAFPTSFVQRSSLTFNTGGIRPYSAPQPYFTSRSFEKGFIADRPFMFSLLDGDSYTSLLTAAYSYPTYPYYPLL